MSPMQRYEGLFNQPDPELPTRCRACQTEIVFVYSQKNPRAYPTVPVDWASLSEQARDAVKAGERVEFNGASMVSHFSTCPSAAEFSRHKKGKKP